MSNSSQNEQFTFGISTDLPKQQHREQEDVPMEELNEPITVTPINEDEEENGSSFSASFVKTSRKKLAMVKDLPKFKILSDDTKDTADAFVTVNQYFKAFERTLRMQNIELQDNRKDNLANVIGMDHADWYADTTENDDQTTSLFYSNIHLIC